MKYPSYLEAYIHSISPEQKRGKLVDWLVMAGRKMAWSFVIALLSTCALVLAIDWARWVAS